MRGSRRGAFYSGWMLLLLSIVIVAQAMARTASVPLNAKKIIQDVNARYREQLSKPRIVEVAFSSITRQENQMDTQENGTYLIHQDGHKARMELIDGEARVQNPVSLNRPNIYPVHKTLVWVYDEDKKVIYMISETHPSNDQQGKTMVSAKMFKTNREGLPNHLRMPLGQDEIPKVMANSEWKVREEVLNGKKAWVLDSQETIQLQPDTKLLSTMIWVDPESLLIMRIETNMEYRYLDRKGKTLVTFLSSKYSIKTTFVNRIDPAMFTLPLPKGAQKWEDFTDKVVGPLQR